MRIKPISPLAMHSAEQRLYRLNILVAVLAALLLSVVFVYLQDSLILLNILPDISVSLLLALLFGIGGSGVYLVCRLQKNVLAVTEDYTGRLDSLIQVTGAIKEEVYGDLLLDKIMQSSMDITRSEAGSILLVEENALVFKVVKGDKAGQLVGKSVPLSKGIGGWVLKEGVPVLIHDARNDPRFDNHVDEITGYQTLSIMCVPLKIDNITIGVIELLNKKTGAYSERDLQLVSYLADHASIAIERVRFLEDHKNYEIHLMDILLDTMDRFLQEKYGHSRRVAKYATLIGKNMGLPDSDIRRLYIASQLHDIGFLKLSPEDSYEKEKYLRHAEIGFEMLNPINFYKDIAPFILHHHERWDGHGYPYKLKGDNIPLGARIIAVAEAYDSMVSRVSYRIAITSDQALAEIMRCRGTQFDPKVADVFIDAMVRPGGAGQQTQPED